MVIFLSEVEVYPTWLIRLLMSLTYSSWDIPVSALDGLIFVTLLFTVYVYYRSFFMYL